MNPTDLVRAVQANRAGADEMFAGLKACSFDGIGITRASYSEEESRAHKVMADYAGRLGLEVTTDPAANTCMTLPGRDRRAPRIVIGSHLDSVKQGGNFDGAAGVVAGLLAVEALQRAGITPPCDIAVLGIRAEESAWFNVSYIGSRAALGVLSVEAMATQRVDTGRSLSRHIAAAGGDPARIAAGDAWMTTENVRAFLELHIEQGPILDREGLAVGIVTGIPGNFRHPEARVIGEYGHVGLLRGYRHDAMLAAAELAVALDATWQEWERQGRSMAVTIGQFFTDPELHALTKVPGELRFSLDIRSCDPAALKELEALLHAKAQEIAARRGVRFEFGRRTSAAPGVIDPGIRGDFERIANAAGIVHRRLESPASHDAAAFAAAGIPTGMLFVRNANGSHNPAEAMEIDDFLMATGILAAWLAEMQP
ncbi:Zn-dependent hydrolase [Desertibaculum subflavum]|uniref:Zn-dependent hydrolase n=1 Tax=Desertibaculum subflavum TaxID=2268458 RepID=UPI000E669366